MKRPLLDRIIFGAWLLSARLDAAALGPYVNGVERAAGVADSLATCGYLDKQTP
jgi:hypothetical protein